MSNLVFMEISVFFYMEQFYLFKSVSRGFVNSTASAPATDSNGGANA
jgi:hypothetical protein